MLCSYVPLFFVRYQRCSCIRQTSTLFKLKFALGQRHCLTETHALLDQKKPQLEGWVWSSNFISYIWVWQNTHLIKKNERVVNNKGSDPSVMHFNTPCQLLTLTSLFACSNKNMCKVRQSITLANKLSECLTMIGGYPESGISWCRAASLESGMLVNNANNKENYFELFFQDASTAAWRATASNQHSVPLLATKVGLMFGFGLLSWCHRTFGIPVGEFLDRVTPPCCRLARHLVWVC